MIQTSSVENKLNLRSKDPFEAISNINRVDRLTNETKSEEEDDSPDFKKLMGNINSPTKQKKENLKQSPSKVKGEFMNAMKNSEYVKSSNSKSSDKI